MKCSDLKAILHIISICLFCGSKALQSSATVMQAIAPGLAAGAGEKMGPLIAHVNSNSPQALSAVMRSTAQLAVAPQEVAALSMPVLALIGEDDRGFAAVERLTEARLKTDVIRTPGHHHNTLFTREFAVAMRDWLRMVANGQQRDE